MNTNIKKSSYPYRAALITSVLWGMLVTSPHAVSQQNMAQVPLFLTSSVPGVVMINMSVDSQLFFTAFPESADLSGNGEPDRGYIHSVDYFGYFDPYKCYSYNDGNGRFAPQSITADKYCNGNEWSGNFLNWTTMARIDTVRQILYGGKRHIDNTSLTVLERSYLPNDSHSWVRFYDGNDLNLLSPYSSPDETTTSSPTSLNIIQGSRRNNNDNVEIDTPDWSTGDAFPGDQIELTHPNHAGLWMRGVITSISLGSNPSVDVQITGSENPNNVAGPLSNWQIVNRSRRGLSFCNTTEASGASHGANAIAAPPLLKVAEGDYSLWTANERWQCRWRGDVNPNVPARMRINDRSFTNGNDVVSSGLWSNADMPRENEVGLSEMNVRVEVCQDGLIGTERCQAYGPSNIFKPVGLLQEFSEDDLLHFGLMTGTYSNHVSGGALRKNLGTFSDEVNPQTGEFILPEDSMIRSLDALRIFGYSHDSGEHTAGAENCAFGTSKAQMIGGRCFSWGNPQAEIYAESLRYLSGLNANSNFTHSGDDRIPQLRAAEWENPITEAEWCTPKSIIQFNASVTSFDDGAPAASSDLPGIGNLNDWTNTVGTGENLAGASVFAGGNNGFCTAENIGNLADFSGVCPEAPNQDGTYHIAGLAHYAYTNDLRPTWQGEQTVRTYGVSLAPAVPRIEIPKPGETTSSVIILPACDNRGDNLRCALADFRIVEQNIQAGTGSFYIQWDVSEWGADFDMDINGTLSYEIVGNDINVTTQTWADSSGRETGFGYIISGTNNDGFHAHSGINNYRRTNAGSVPNCTGCNVGDPPTTANFGIGGGTAELLLEPLYYAAKWGGYNKELSERRIADNLDGFPEYDETWEDPNRPGLPQNYFFAVNPADLLVGLRAALADFVGRIDSSATAAAVSSAVVEEDTRAFYAGFRSTDWSGSLTSRPIDRNGNVEPIGCEDCWNAETKLAAKAVSGSRKIFSRRAGLNDLVGQGDGIQFAWGNLDSEQQAALNHDPQGVNDGRGVDRISWLTGTELPEFRSRVDSGNRRLLGDIINSNPVYFENVLYVGANDGMLHAFDGETGEELFAYIPSKLLLPEDNESFAPLSRLMAPDYIDNHRYFVDGQIEVRQVLHNNTLRTILLGSLGAGGNQVFALDVTEPDNFSTNDILWEFTDSEMGASVGTPQIARTQPNGDWSVFLSNGYGSASHEAGLFILDLFTGEITEFISTETGDATNSNGLATPFVTDWPNGGFRADRVYAGDTQGNLWAFDVSNSNSNRWSVRLLAEATDPDGLPQPITTKPIGQVLSDSQVMISFGTGSFKFAPDSNDNQIQSLYGVIDTVNSSPQAVERDDLVAQEIIYETSVTTAGGVRNIRVVSDNLVDLIQNSGWILDLDWSNGERIISNPRTLGRQEKRVRFSSLIPDNDVCGTGREGFFYDLDLRTGGRLEVPVFDFDGDGEFGDGDLVDVPGVGLVPASGIGLGQGESITPIVTTGEQESGGSDGIRSQLICDGQGNCERARDADQTLGRMTWQQLR